jgi:hypothetical protein
MSSLRLRVWEKAPGAKRPRAQASTAPRRDRRVDMRYETRLGVERTEG